MTGNDVDLLCSDLNDPNYRTWTLPERITWMNAGVREIATLKPRASSSTSPVQLAAGTTRQVRGSNVINVLDLTCNLGADGATPGRRITAVSADLLGSIRPNWRRETGPAVKHLVNDDRDPDAYYVWPAVKTTWYVEALQQVQPAEIAALADTLPLDKSYCNALAAYVMHMAYSRDAENGYSDLAMAQYVKFGQILGVQVQKQKKSAPLSNTRENPQYPAVDKNGAP